MIEVPDLYSIVYELVKQIPPGKVSTYGEIARALGDIRAARAIGEILSKNPTPIVVPCHRVVCSDGSLGGFTHPEGLKKKIELLRSEGVEIVGGKIDLNKYMFKDFKLDKRPLEELRRIQRELSKKVSLETEDFDVVCGFDAAYFDRKAVGALVCLGDEVTVLSDVFEVKFPYIPGYLGFREFPFVRELVRRVKGKPLIFLDGHGILHPRKFGYATHVGVLLDLPTVGVAKALLVGKYDKKKLIEEKKAPVYLDGELRGYAVLGGKARNPIFVSPGNKISVHDALKVCLQNLKYRVPEPTRLAHIWANKIKREKMFERG